MEGRLKNTFADKEKAYSFGTYEETGEIHIFEGYFNPEGGCTKSMRCICKKVYKSECEFKYIITRMCLNEDEARKKAAKLGRKVCGNCVSSLYTSYED